MTRPGPFMEGTSEGTSRERATGDAGGETADRVKANGERGTSSGLRVLAAMTAVVGDATPAPSRGIAITGTAPPAQDPAGKGIAWTGKSSRGEPLTVTVSGTVNFWLPLAVTVILACSTCPGVHGT